MNRQLIKSLKAGISAGCFAAVIEIIISAAMGEYTGTNIEVAPLVLGGATIGFITLAMTLIVSTVIAGRRQKI